MVLEKFQTINKILILTKKIILIDGFTEYNKNFIIIHVKIIFQI